MCKYVYMHTYKRALWLHSFLQSCFLSFLFVILSLSRAHCLSRSHADAHMFLPFLSRSHSLLLTHALSHLHTQLYVWYLIGF